MSPRNDFRLDGLVRSALRAGTMRPTPFGLHGRIWRRLEIVAMVEGERTRFRNAVWRVSFIAIAVTLLIAAVCWLWNPLASVVEEVPGLLGLVDYSVAYTQSVALSIIAAAEWWFWAGAGTTILLALILGSRTDLASHFTRRSQ